MKVSFQCFFAIILLTFCIQPINAQHKNDFWSIDTSIAKNVTTMQTEYSSKMYMLNLDDLTALLLNFVNTNNADKIIVAFPDSDGNSIDFEIQEASVLSESLQEKYPNIRSFIGKAVTDETLSIRFSIAYDGFHAIILGGEKTIIINPISKDNLHYEVYKKELHHSGKESFECGFKEEEIDEVVSHFGKSVALSNDGDLRTYRLALACTGEYSQFHLDFQGVSPGASDAVKKLAVLSAMTTTVTRVNSIFENELSVTFELVDNTDIIYLDGTTDPYTNDDGVAMLDENQATLTSEVGSSNYDIGHVFSTGGGGIANFQSVCSFLNKARGVTGLSSPIGDIFDIDFVCHEIGHQFGATHTFNNFCGNNIFLSTSVEPGSGSTIMGYAGTCAPNVQESSDSYFHVVSLEQMTSFIISSATCSQNSATGNNAPTITPIGDYHIPKSTAFVLRGNANDVDGNETLTYCWEQTNIGQAGLGGVAAPPDPNSSSGAMFRSLPPKSSPDRYLPALGTTSSWEVIPNRARELDFSLTVRDNDNSGGRYAVEEMTVIVEDVEPFQVVFPEPEDEWPAGSTQTVTWNVGSTDQAPINCNFVTIKMSLDGGFTFPAILVANTPNDGSQEITVPLDPNSGDTFVMVEAVDNIFYDISGVLPTLSIDDEKISKTFSTFNLYPNPTTGNITLSLESNTNETIEVDLYDLTGRLINKQSFKASNRLFTTQLIYTTFDSGVYILKVKQGSQVTAKRLFIQ